MRVRKDRMRLLIRLLRAELYRWMAGDPHTGLHYHVCPACESLRPFQVAIGSISKPFQGLTSMTDCHLCRARFALLWPNVGRPRLKMHVPTTAEG
jgi:hypothetical protein